MEGIGGVVLSTGSIVDSNRGGPGTADRVARAQGTQEEWMGLEKEDFHESSLSGRSRRTVITQETIKKKNEETWR